MKPSLTSVIFIILAVLAIFAMVYFGHARENGAADTSDPSGCVASPGELCPSPDFLADVKTLKHLNAKQKELSNDPKIKALVSLVDQEQGMSERLQSQIVKTIQSNPGYQWNGDKERFVKVAQPQVPPSPIPVPAPATAPVKR